MQVVVCALAALAMSAMAQTQPVARDLTAVSADILAAVESVKSHASFLLKELEKKQCDRRTVQAQAEQAVAQAKQIRKLIEELDAFYAKMPEAQQSALRRSWSVATILNGCMESALDSLADNGNSVWSEVRTGVECAQRRASQLEEVLAPFRVGR
ncbi:MAG: hypothetical protein ACUVS7_07125 [Bryobacteraceae bacterium]